MDWWRMHRRSLRRYVVANVVVVMADTRPVQLIGAAEVAIPAQFDRWT